MTGSRSLHQQMVDAFMHRAKQDLPSRPVAPLASVLRLRARLILEEALETIDALGYRVRDPELLVRERPGVLDLVEIVDGCCDIMVVTTGTLSACGVSDLPVQLAVDINNLAKFGGDGRLDEYGKWVKPSDHQPPNLKEVLRALSAAG